MRLKEEVKETEPRLRPAEKPKQVTDEEWELSACDKSPTCAHWFKPAPSGMLQCVYCERFHDKIYPNAPGKRMATVIRR